LPEADPIREDLKADYFLHIASIKEELDAIPSQYLETAIAKN